MLYITMQNNISPCPYCDSRIVIEPLFFDIGKSPEFDIPKQFTPHCPVCHAGCWDFSNEFDFKNKHHEAPDYFNTYEQALTAWNDFATRINSLGRPLVNIDMFLKRLRENEISISYDNNLCTLLLKSKNQHALNIFHSFIAERPEYERTLLASKNIPFMGIDERDNFFLKARKFMYEQITPIFEILPEDLDTETEKQKNFWLDIIHNLNSGVKNLPAAVLHVMRGWQKKNNNSAL